MAGNVTWSTTLPHTALAISYQDFFKACPIEGNILRCDREGSYHFSDPEAGSTTLRIPFQGSAIEIYGTVADGLQYTTEVAGSGVVQGQPNGTLLARHENIPRPYSWIERTLELTTTRFGAAGSLNFTHAIVYVDTYAIEGTPEVTTYLPDSANVKLTPGWGRNGSYWQASNTSDQVIQFDFEGNSFLAYGMCTNTNQAFDTVLGELPEVDGRLTLRGYLDSSTTGPYAVEDCLITWELWLQSGKHNFTWNTAGDPIMISRFEVVKFPDPPPPGSVVGTRTRTNPSSTRSNGSPTSSNSTSGSGSLGTGGVVGITFAIIIILLAAVFGVVCWIQRNNRRNTPAMTVEDMYGKTDSPQSPGSHLSPQSVPTLASAPAPASATALVPTPVLPGSPMMANAPVSYNVTPLPLLQHNQPPLPAGNPTYYSSYNPYSSYPPMGGGSQVDVKRPLDFQEGGSVAAAAPVPEGGALAFRPLPSPSPPSPAGAYPSPASGPAWQAQLPVGPSTTSGYSAYDSPRGPTLSVSDSASASGRGGPAESPGNGRTVLSADGYANETPSVPGGVQARS